MHGLANGNLISLIYSDWHLIFEFASMPPKLSSSSSRSSNSHIYLPMVAKILLPSFIIKRYRPDEAKREQFHNLTNIYLFIFLWHIVVLFVGCFSLDQCTDVFHEDLRQHGALLQKFQLCIVCIHQCLGTLHHRQGYYIIVVIVLQQVQAHDTWNCW